MVAPEQLGAYRIVGELGRGGMGVVYHGVDEETGRSVAVKALQSANPAMVDAIAREIKALNRLEHPGLVKIESSGIAGGLPWYAMELIEGFSLAELMRTPRDPVMGATEFAQTLAATAHTSREVTLELDGELEPLLPFEGSGDVAGVNAEGIASRLVCLRVITQVCDVLAYLHGEGVVHCDLKPGNILLRLDGTPALVDFGIAGRFRTRRAVLEPADAMAGTAYYISPEQIEGEQVGPRADLYALGCVLYEILVGRPPFMGKTPAVVMMMHLSRPAPPIEGDAPRALVELVASLLEKDRRQRPGHAGVVASVLKACGADASWRASLPVSRGYLYQPRFIGREAVLEGIKQLGRQARGQRVKVALFEGEGGVGKTRAMSEAASLLRGSGFQVVVSRGGGVAPGGVVPPLEAWRPCLVGLVKYIKAAGGEGSAERILGDEGGRLAGYFPVIEEVVEAGEAFASRDETFICLAEVLARWSRDAPLGVFIDDLHDVDAMSLAFLEWLAGTHGSVVVVGSARPGEVSDALSSLAQVIRLARFGREAIGALVGEMLAVAPPDAFVEQLHARSGGNPLLVAEHLHTALEIGALRRDGKGRWHVRRAEDLPLPRTLQKTLSPRFERLSSRASRFVAAASVVGRRVNMGVVVGIGGLSPEDALRAVHELLKSRIFEHSADDGALAFAHETMREVAYAQLDDALRRDLHSRAADTLRALSPSAASSVGADLGAVALHLERSGRREEARVAYLGAARLATRRFAFSNAEHHYRKALELTHTMDAEGLEARFELATWVLKQRRDNAEAFELLRDLVDDAAALGDRALSERAALQASVVARQMGNLSDSRAVLEGLIATIRARPETAATQLQLARVLNSYGNVLRKISHTSKDCMDAYREALQLARRCGDLKHEGVVLDNLGILHGRLGNFEAAGAMHRDAASIFRLCGDRDNECRSALNLMALTALEGKLRTTLEAARAAHALVQEVNNRHYIAICARAVAGLMQMTGDLKGVEVYQEEAIALSAEIKDTSVWAAALLDQVYTMLDQRRLEEAASQLETIRALKLEDPSFALETLVGSVRLALLRGDDAEVVRLSSDAVSTADFAQHYSAIVALLELLTEAHLRLGEVEAARALALMFEERTCVEPDVELALRLIVARTLRHTGADRARVEALLERVVERLDPAEVPIAAARCCAERVFFDLWRESPSRGAVDAVWLDVLSGIPGDLSGAPAHPISVARSRVAATLADLERGAALRFGESVRVWEVGSSGDA